MDSHSYSPSTEWQSISMYQLDPGFAGGPEPRALTLTMHSGKAHATGKVLFSLNGSARLGAPPSSPLPSLRPTCG